MALVDACKHPRVKYVCELYTENSTSDIIEFYQAVSISLFSTGFGESMAETTGWDSPWAVRVIGLITALILLVVVLAGVKWVVKLQLLLLAILMLSVLDFLVGTFAHTDYCK